MSQKYIFPDNWNSLTDILALQTVEYLCQNCSRYKINIVAANEIHIGKNIVITCDFPTKKHNDIPVFTINGRSFDLDLDRKLVYDLFVACKEYKTKTIHNLYEKKQNKK